MTTCCVTFRRNANFVRHFVARWQLLGATFIAKWQLSGATFLQICNFLAQLSVPDKPCEGNSFTEPTQMGLAKEIPSHDPSSEGSCEGISLTRPTWHRKWRQKGAILQKSGARIMAFCKEIVARNCNFARKWCKEVDTLRTNAQKSWHVAKSGAEREALLCNPWTKDDLISFLLTRLDLAWSDLTSLNETCFALVKLELNGRWLDLTWPDVMCLGLTKLDLTELGSTWLALTLIDSTRLDLRHRPPWCLISLACEWPSQLLVADFHRLWMTVSWVD